MEYITIFATLSSILDSQQSWKSGKYQLARWSHEVVLKSLDHPPTQPPTQPSTELVICTGTRIWGAVSPPLIGPVQKVCAVSPSPIGTLFRNMCGVPTSQYTLFLCCVPPSLEQFGSALDSEQNWESCKFQVARWSQAQLVSSSVALLAELVTILLSSKWD